MLIGNKIPKDFFITSGCGESDFSHHAGSFHLALKDASIEKANIIVYSSILPAIATKINQPKNVTQGEVMSTIMAKIDGLKGERLTAGIITAWLYDRITDEKTGGLVCEYTGKCTKDELKMYLRNSLQEIYQNGFSDRDMREENIYYCSFRPKKKFGTALVAICFVNHILPNVK